MARFSDRTETVGLTDLRMIISDAYGGVAAEGWVFPTLLWQRCRFRFARNITSKFPVKYRVGLS